MNLECENCGQKYFVQGTDGNNIVEGSCDTCGGGLLPERDQPSPTVSDGRPFNMVDPASGKDMGGDPLTDGILADGGWQNRKVRDESFASVQGSWNQRVASALPEFYKEAEWNPDAFNIDFGGGGAPQPTHKFIYHAGKVHALPEPTHHEQVAEAGGIIDQFPDGMSTGVLMDDGSTQWYTHESGASPDEMATALGQHFGQDITIDPNLKPTTTQERFKLNDLDYKPEERRTPNFDLKRKQEQEAVGVRGRPFGYYENPYFNRGGSTHLEPLDVNAVVPWNMGGHVSAFWDDAVNNVQQMYHHPEEGVPGLGNPLNPGDITKPIGEQLGDAAQVAGLAAGGAGLAAGGARLGIGNLLTKAVPAGGVGGLMKGVLRRAPGSIAKGLIVNKLLSPGGAGGQPQQAQGPAPSETLQAVTHVLAETESINSVPSLGTDGDPEHADTHEFNDGSATTNPQDPRVDEAGGADTPATALLDELEPILLDYYMSDKSGADDPRIQALDDALEREHPGYKDEGDEDHPELAKILQQFHSSRTAAWPVAPGINPQFGVPGQAAPAARPQPNVGPPSGQGRCPICGATLAGNACPQCGYQENSQLNPDLTHPTGQGSTGIVQNARVADTQGPANPEQFKAVSEALIEAGRVDEIPHMFEAPWEYADLLAEVQNKTQPPPPSVPQPAQPPQPDPSMMGMPPGGPGGPPPGAPPGGDPSMQMAAALQRMARPQSFVPSCPNCGSHTTGVSEDTFRCHSCGNAWTPKGGIEHDSRVALKHPKQPGEHSHPQIEADPAADQDVARDIEEENDPSGTWQTEDGQPLIAGQEYEMHSKNYDIPDVVRITQKKPDELVFEITGEFEDLDHENKITKEEADLEGITFVPSLGDKGRAGEGADDYLKDVPGAPQNTVPTETSQVPFTSNIAMPQQQIIAQLSERVDQLTAALEQMGRRSAEEIPGIDTQGVAGPRADVLTLQDYYEQMAEAQGHAERALQEGNAAEHMRWGRKYHELADYIQSLTGEEPRPQQSFASAPQQEFVDPDDMTNPLIDPRAASALGIVPSGVTSSVPMVMPEGDLTGREWLLEGIPTPQRVAGAKFTPSEQKVFIDEEGEARNLDKLDLGGTHYEFREARRLDPDGIGVIRNYADPTRVPDNHLAWGL